MPFTEVMHKFKHGKLHSGSKKGPKVKNRSQAIAIMMSEKRKAKSSGNSDKKKEYMDVGPSAKLMKKHNV